MDFKIMTKLGVFTLLSLFSFNLFAGLEMLQIEKMDFSFLAPEGEGKIKKFKFGVDTRRDPPTHVKSFNGSGEGDGNGSGRDFLHDINIKIVNKDIYIESDFSYIVWREAPGFFTKSVKIFTRNLDLFFTKKRNTLTADSLYYDFENSKFKIFKLDLGCSDITPGRRIARRLLDNCLLKSHLNLDKFQFDIQTPELTNFMMEQTNSPVDISFDTVKNFNFIMNKSEFKAKMKVEFGIAHNLEVSGKLKMDFDKQELYIDVYKIKLGLVNVTKAALFALKKAKIQNMKIHKKRIIIQF
jgi:hypothetical protein